jgi:carboxyl-terminal processing protease
MAKLTFSRQVRTLVLRGIAVLALASLAACGSGGGSGGASSTAPTWQPGVFAPSSSFAAQCATPRSGIDPVTGRNYPDVQGSTLDENNYLRSWTHELYLWYSEVPDTDPAGYTTADYFDLLKTSAITPSGRPKDRFHFTYPTDVWEQLSQSGVQAGYGVEWSLLAAAPPRKVMVAYTEPGSPATAVNLSRGAQLLTVDGVDVANGSSAALNAGMFPATAGETHTFEILDPGASAPRTVTLQSAEITTTPVRNVKTVSTANGVVGYILFNDQIASAESELIAAIDQFKAAGVSDLVLDIRYNGGGYIDIASELAYMIAGPAQTTGHVFERIQFNDKYSGTNPVTLQPLTPTPFHSQSQGFSVASGQALPALNLARVYVLTTAGTCSASESIINGLRGIGVQVIQIGSTTCGKPYGFYPQDNCGTTYFTIEFRGVNDAGFGDYADGFSPQNTVGTIGVAVPGCSVADDFTHALGDPLEGQFAAALAYRASGNCPAPSGFAPNALAQRAMRGATATAGTAAADDVLREPPLRENRWYR